MKTKAKIIKLKSVELHDLVKACQQNDRSAQKELYDQYAPLFLSICYRYLSQKDEAEDAMISAFYTIFSKIDKYSGSGSFEGWMKRVVVNTCLMTIRKKKVIKTPIEEIKEPSSTEVSALEGLYVQDILDLIKALPTGYRTVFNLFVIEGYKHREIAEILDISINTSKSQLIQARKMLVSLLSQLENGNHYESK